MLKHKIDFDRKDCKVLDYQVFRLDNVLSFGRLFCLFYKIFFLEHKMSDFEICRMRK